MKGYNITRAANGEYDDVQGIESGRNGFQSELQEEAVFYGDVGGTSVALVVGDGNDSYPGYDNTLRFRYNTYDGFTVYGLKWVNGNGTSSDSTFPMGVYTENGKVGDYFADPPSSDSGARALGIEFGSTHVASSLSRRETEEVQSGSDYKYLVGGDPNDPLWIGAQDGQWSSNYVAFVGPSESLQDGDWTSKAVSRTKAKVEIIGSLPSNLCRGSSETVEVKVTNDHAFADIRGTLTITNQLTGSSTNESLNVSPDSTSSFDVEVNVPEGASLGQQDIVTISMETDADTEPSVVKTA